LVDDDIEGQYKSTQQNPGSIHGVVFILFLKMIFVRRFHLPDIMFKLFTAPLDREIPKYFLENNDQKWMHASSNSSNLSYKMNISSIIFARAHK
jgi:hypothetical protein